MSHTTNSITNTYQTGCSDCGFSEWIVPTQDHDLEPPGNTIAVIVDLRSDQGKNILYSKDGDGFSDRIGTNGQDGNLIIVPWKRQWGYFAIEETRIAYILLLRLFGRRNSSQCSHTLPGVLKALA
jgi:hypothetical protein